MDRRIKRTKGAVYDAMINLMIEKETRKITVLELCKKADINKSTFYLHYKSIDDCIQKCFKLLLNNIIEFSKQINYYEMRNDPLPTVTFLVDELEKNSATLNKFKNSRICGHSLKLIKENLVKSIVAHNGFTKENNYREITNITFAVGGFIDVAIEMLPDINREHLTTTMCKMIKACA